MADGREFLAGAGFAGNEHGRVGDGDLADGAEQRQHGVARADHVALGERDRGARSAGVVVKSDHAVRVAYGVYEAITRYRHGDEVEAMSANCAAKLVVFHLTGTHERDPADRSLGNEFN